MKRIRQGLFWCSITAVLLVFLFPIYWIISVSFKPEFEVLRIPPTLFPSSFSLENYLAADQKIGLIRLVINSTVIAGTSTFIAVICGSLGAYALSRYRFKGSNLIPFLVLILRMIPPIAIIMPLFVAMRTLRLIDNYIGLILVYSGWNIPYALWLMKGFIDGLPRDIEEAAKVDGATELGAFIRIVLPLAAPGIVVAFILCFVIGWDEFLFALVLTGTGTMTLPVGLNQFQSQNQVYWGPSMAAGVVAAIPAILLAAYIQRYLIKGLTLGAVK
jgi:multiple sugar transport system permease protein